MAFRKSALWAFVLALVLLLVPNLASAKKASHIELKDGTVFEQVTYKVDKAYKVITIRDGKEKRTVSFSDIAAIIDGHGTDITIEILGRYYTEPGTVANPILIADPAEPPPGGKRFPYTFAIHAQPNFSVPIGDFYTGFKPGIGFGADISFPVSHQIAIRGSVSKSGMTTDFEMPAGVSFTVMRYSFAAQYYDWPNWRTDGKMMYYLYTGIGAINHTFSVGSDSEDISRLMTTLGFGLVHQFSESIGLEAGGEIDWVYIGTEKNKSDHFGFGEVQYALVMDFKVGLVLLL
jgi:hypothetical protein